MKTNQKKLVATICLSLIGAGAFAQTSEGSLAVAGSMNLRKETIRNHNSLPGEHKIVGRTINLNPAVGYFVKDGLEMGVGIGLSQYAAKTEYEENVNFSRNNTISLRPYARKYVALTEQLQLHGTGYAMVGYGNSKIKNTADNSSEVTHTSNVLGIGLYPGLTYFATPKLGFTATFGALSFERRREKPKDSMQSVRTTETFLANFHPSSVSVGFGYFIAR